MTAYLVTFEVYASCEVEVQLPAGATAEQVVAAAYRKASPSLCHECSHELNIDGGIGDPTSVFNVDAGHEMTVPAEVAP